MKNSIFEMPPRLAVAPKTMPIYRINHPVFEPNGPQAYWRERAKQLSTLFDINSEASDAGDRLVLQNSRQTLFAYKPSDSFLFFDRKLVALDSPKLADNILSETKARYFADDFLQRSGLAGSHLVPSGIGYTHVSSAKVETTASSDHEYRIQINVYHDFHVGEHPVFGPGARFIHSFVENQTSQILHFWRTPQERPIGERALLPLESIPKIFARDTRFAHLKPGDAKIRFSDIRLGYYALPPYALQQFYLPVYQIKGMVETRNSEPAPAQNSPERWRYHFTHYLPALRDMSAGEQKASGFPAPMGKTNIF
jgi:hypothetical protein